MNAKYVYLVFVVLVRRFCFITCLNGRGFPFLFMCVVSVISLLSAKCEFSKILAFICRLRDSFRCAMLPSATAESWCWIFVVAILPACNDNNMLTYSMASASLPVSLFVTYRPPFNNCVFSIWYRLPTTTI